MAGLYFLPWGLTASALGWYLSIKLWRSWRKSVPWFRRECAAWSHAYLCGEMSVGEVAAPVGLWIPIISVPSVFHGDVVGTSET